MALAPFLLLISRLCVGAICAFFAIILWSRTRDGAWILVVLGALLAYVDILLTTLEAFGIIAWEGLLWNGIPIYKLAATNLPLLFLTVAFIVAIGRKSRL